LSPSINRWIAFCNPLLLVQTTMITGLLLHPLFQNLLNRARDISRSNPPKVVLPLPDESDLKFLAEIVADGMAIPVIIGAQTEIRVQWERLGSHPAEILDASNNLDAITQISHLVQASKVDILMRGGLSCDELVECVGIRNGRLISHAAVVALPTEGKLLTISDGGWNLLPDLHQTAGIIHNCVVLLKSIGIAAPRIAILSAVEDIDPRIPRTMEAASLSQMSHRGLFDPAIVDGPLRFDHAIALPQGHEPPFSSPVAGNADAVIAGSIEEANILTKALVLLGKGQFGGVILGGSVPIAYPTCRTSPNQNSTGVNPLISLSLAIQLWNTLGEMGRK
jgi:phosphotransacetylase